MIGLGTRIALTVAVAAMAPLLAAALAWLPLARGFALQQAQARLESDAHQAAQALDARLTAVEVAARILARDAVSGPIERERLQGLLLSRVQIAEDVHAAQILTEPAPGATDAAALGFHLSQRGPLLQIRDFVAEGYDFPNKLWYLQAMQHAEGRWAGAYFNQSAGGRDTLTFHLPMQWPQQPERRGLISLDVALDRLDALAASLGLSASDEGRQAAVVDAAGRVLTHSDPLRARTERVTVSGGLMAGAEWIAAPEAGSGHVLRLTDSRGQHWLGVRRPVGTRGAAVVLSLDESRVLAALHSRALQVAYAVGAVLLALAVLAGWSARRLTRPLSELAQAAQRLADADFGTALTLSGRRDEIGQLEQALERARSAVSERGKALAAAADRDRQLGAELDLARLIQHAMLPRDRVFLSGHDTVTLAGTLLAAKAVGGDFYSFFAMGPGALCFFIGDVSDKGVPSALFAARLSALLANHARHSESPVQALQATATELYRSNDTGLFATVLIGMLRVDDGQLRLASAGHESPLLFGADHSRQWIELASGPALGFEEHPEYPEWCGRLAIGAQLILLTDGVTEAMTAQHEEFGRERVEVALERHEPSTPQRCVQALVSEVERFAGDAERSDDLTLLVLGRAERVL